MSTNTEATHPPVRSSQELDSSPPDKEPNYEAFLIGLTELSRLYWIGITGSPVLFRMEYGHGVDGDFDRSYRCDEEGHLEFI